MKNTRTFTMCLAAAFLLLVMSQSTIRAQARDFHTQRVVLDDGNGHTTTMGASGTTSTFTFPTGGTAGQEIQTDGAGNLSWTTPSAPAVTSGTIVWLPSANGQTGYTYTGNSQVLVAANSWATKSSLGFTARAFLSSSVVNGKIYAMGGSLGGITTTSTLQVYDPSLNSWSTPVTTGAMTSRYELTSAVVNGKIYAIGGMSFSTGFLNTLEVFDPSTNVWSTPLTTGTMTPRSLLASAQVNGKIYVFGGYGNAGFLSTLEVFDASTSTWSTPSTIGSMTARYGMTASEVNGKIFIMGGANNSGYITSIETFDPSSSTWSTLSTTLTAPRLYPASAVTNGYIYLVAGEGLSGDLNTVEVFDPVQTSWNSPPIAGSMTARNGLACAVFKSTIYAIGGYSSALGVQGTNEALSTALTIYAFTKD